MRHLMETAWHPVSLQAGSRASLPAYGRRPHRGMQAHAGTARITEVAGLRLNRLAGAAVEKFVALIWAIAFAILLVVMFLEINLMPQKTTLNRVMRVRSVRGDEIEVTLKRTTGRQPMKLGCQEESDGTIVHSLQIDIYRLEEQTLKDAVYAIDPDAVIDMLPQYVAPRGGRPTGSSR